MNIIWLDDAMKQWRQRVMEDLILHGNSNVQNWNPTGIQNTPGWHTTYVTPGLRGWLMAEEELHRREDWMRQWKPYIKNVVKAQLDRIQHPENYIWKQLDIDIESIAYEIERDKVRRTTPMQWALRFVKCKRHNLPQAYCPSPLCERVK